MKKRIFSGVQPTGSIHIGNYLGAIKNWAELQNEYDSVYCIVDLHALTIPQDPEKLRKKIIEVASIYLASGLDPEKCILFVQSHVKEHTELAWLLNTVTPISELERMTQFKDKAQQFKNNINMGLFNYPVLMAADILLYKTDIVPVGEDQKQHVEMARTIARKFNNQFGETFILPNALIKKENARIMGLDNPLNKMSKSSSNLYNYIAMTDSPDIIQDKIKKAVTDSEQGIKYTPKRPAIANLMTIYSAFSNLSLDKIEEKYDNKNYSDFKKGLAEVIIKGLEVFQKIKKALDKKPDYIKEILENGAKKAQEIAQKNILIVKKKMGLI